MTVAELIEHLKTLDQDRGIWVAYDFPCSLFEPIPDERADETYVSIYGDEKGVKLDDYVIVAG